MNPFLLFCALGGLKKTVALLVSVLGFLIFTSTLRSQQPTSEPQPVRTQTLVPQHAPGEADRVISLLNGWVTILNVMVTIVIAISAGSTIYQNWRVRKDGERIKIELMAQVEKDLNALKETYELVSLKPPEEILQEARREYEPPIALLRQWVEAQYTELTSAMSTANAELKTNSEASMAALSNLRGELLQRPTKDSVLQEVDRKYKSPVDLQESTLRKVLNAFLEMKNLSNEERTSISNALTTAPVVLPNSPSDKSRSDVA
ncbi:MAG TPA: hypothetical protein VNP98_05275 [Chthoniobacterales bacterium]|nr:hypothetical protein [Chthoniobacterales bacterium]